MSKLWKLINPQPGYLVIIADKRGRILTDNSESYAYTAFLVQQIRKKPYIKMTKETQTHDKRVNDNKPNG